MLGDSLAYLLVVKIDFVEVNKSTLTLGPSEHGVVVLQIPHFVWQSIRGSGTQAKSI